jgi:pterin-4a-carbinolamine dehydratase
LCAFTKENESIIVIEESSHFKYQSTLEEGLIKEIGGYKLYHLKKELKNPFFNDGVKLESIFYFDDKDEELAFKKCKYLINKIFVLASQLEHYPKLSYDGKRSVTVEISTHEGDENITIRDEVLADRITNIWNTIK